MIRLVWVIIEAYALWAWYHLYRPYRERMKAEAEKRIAMCESCEFFNNARQCSICMCLMDVKVTYPFKKDENGISIEGCPQKRW